jgi:sulfoxide reductase catalytic subunit YedY
MHIIRRPGWWLPDSAATPESVFFNRRALLAGSAALIGGAALPSAAFAADEADPSAGLYPFPRNEKYKLDRAITPQPVNENYNNFYEFGSFKRVASAAQALKTRPWTIKVGGLVEKPFEIGIDDLLAKMPKEERPGPWRFRGRASR